MNANVIQFPATVLAGIPAELRELADQIERGELRAHNVAYVVDTGDGFVEVGLAGKSAEPGACAHLLLCIGARKLENLIRPEVAKEAG